MSKPGRRRTNRYIVLGGAAALVIIAVLAWFLVIRGNDTNAVTYKAGTAEKMTLTSSVSGTGNVSLSTSSVTPSATGTVTGLTVKVGDTVKAGQLLFTLENEQLDIDVENAQNSYDSAVATVNKDYLSVLQAKQDLEDLEDKYNGQSTSSTSASAAVTPSVSLTATASPGSTAAPSGTGSSSSSGSGSGTVTALDIKVAKANVTSAQLAYTSAKTQVESARLSLQQAKNKASARKVTAPISGVVTAVNVANGDDTSSSSSSQSSANSASSPSASSSSSPSASSSSASSSSTAAIVIADKTTFTVDLSLGESDIISVKTGQKAIMTFDAIDSLSLTGKVTKVDSTGTNSSGVVTYTVTVTPDISNDKILGGMSVSANIITQTKTDVIAVPNAAVKTDTSGNSYVLLYKGTNVKPTQQTVVTGLATDSYTEITSGLTAGTKVVIQTVNSKSSTSTTARGSSSILGGSGSGSTRSSGNGFPSGGQLPSGVVPSGG